MWLKKVLEKEFNIEEKNILHRYKSSKFLFISISFIFFLNFYFVWSGFYYSIFIKTIYLTYVLLLVSFFSYLYFLWKITFFGKVKNYIIYIFGFIYFILFILLLLPMIFKWGIFYLKDYFTNLI